MKATYFARVERSDVKAGTYIIVAAEGIKTASGELLYDESTEPMPLAIRNLQAQGNM